MWSSATLRVASTTQQSREVSKAQLHEPQGGRVGERETGKRDKERERETDKDRERDKSDPRKLIKYST